MCERVRFKAGAMVCVSVRDRMREGVCTTAVNILISSISQFLAKEGVGRKEGRRKNRGPSDFKDKNILCYSGTIAIGGQLLLHIMTVRMVLHQL